jgi:hypothetical protein
MPAPEVLAVRESFKCKGDGKPDVQLRRVALAHRRNGGLELARAPIGTEELVLPPEPLLAAVISTGKTIEQDPRGIHPEINV